MISPRILLPPLLFIASALCAFAQPAETGGAKPALLPETPVTDAAWSNSDGKLHFVVVGDRTGGGVNEWPLFDLAMQEINKLRPDFAIMVGDAIQGYTQDPSEITKEWQEFRQHTSALQVPFFIMPGNHDMSSPVMKDWWAQHHGRRYYSFDYEGSHFLILNTHEYWQGNDSSIGPEQVQFALDDLAKAKSAQHTFVFMHVPVWHNGKNAEWDQIEAALSGRPYTVFAGHLHNLSFERRNGARYIVVSTTRGFSPRRDDSQIMELGNFAHYTNVTVEGSEPKITYIEPGGATWPEDIAPIEFQRAARDLLNIKALSPNGLGTDSARFGAEVSIKNALPGPVDVTVQTLPDSVSAWKPVGGALTKTCAVPPNTQAKVLTEFDVEKDRVVPAPRIRCNVTYQGKPLYNLERNMPIVPEDQFRIAEDWHAAGPFKAGTVPTYVPMFPRWSLTKLYEARGPEKGYTAGATFQEGDKTLTWQTLKTEDGFVNLARLAPTPDHSFGYATCAVKCPTAKTVLAEFRADDMGQIYVNGVGIEDERLFRTRSDARYVALPMKEGWNTVVVKVANATGGWTFRLRFADPGSELQFAIEPK
ncbi:MAG: metallophosphoesterase [Candidatus Hydrogenedentes bacterium]|nr:metallophosphoesterase [Candidatus Hydrogenedentota bacterium]